MDDEQSIDLVPIVAYPRKMAWGERYLVTVDFWWELTRGWPYNDEEYAVDCIIDGGLWFRCEILEDSAVVIHRFGGTYGPAKFILTVNDGIALTSHNQFDKPELWLTLRSAGGSPLDSHLVGAIEIVASDDGAGSIEIAKQRPKSGTAQSHDDSSRAAASVSKPVAPGTTSAERTRLRIRVVGSCVEESSDRDVDREFAEFCARLGREMGDRGHTLVISSLSQADGSALEGLASAGLQGSVIFVQRLGLSPEIPLPVDIPVNASYVLAEDPNVTGALNFADAVIALGGDENTRLSCQSALDRRMAIVALSEFGGSAAQWKSGTFDAMRMSHVTHGLIDRLLETSDITQVPRLLLDALESWHEPSHWKLQNQQARVICKIDESSSGKWSTSTGFLVAPRLLVTAHHNIDHEKKAAESSILVDGRSFRLAPEELFVPIPSLDISVIAVSAAGSDDGFLKEHSLPSLKVQPSPPKDAALNIVWYARGAAVVCRSAGKVIRTQQDRFLDYEAVSSPGSSGAPVFDANGEVVAVHCRALREKGANPRHKSGALVSAMIRALAQSGHAHHPLLAEMLRHSGIRDTDNRDVAPQFWVAVLGQGSIRLTSEMLMASHRIGQALAHAGFGLTVGGAVGVDDEVVKAFADAVHIQGGAIDRCLRRVVFANEANAPATEHQEIVYSDEDWIHAVLQRAEAVVLIGGLGFPAKVARIAIQSGKLVLPIAATGADSELILREMLSGGDALSYRGVTRQDFELLARPVSSAVDHIVSLLTRLSTLPSEPERKSAAPKMFVVPKSIKIRNYSMLVPPDKRKAGRRIFEWCVFVDEPEEVLRQIVSVRYELHETIPDPVRHTSDATNRFAIFSSGWGTFQIRITTSFKTQLSIVTEYELELQNDAWPKPERLTHFTDNAVKRVYDSLCSGSPRWCPVEMLASKTRISKKLIGQILRSLEQGNHVRRSLFAYDDNVDRWGATSIVGVSPGREPVTEKDFNLIQSCWRYPKKDAEFGRPMYAFHVVLKAADPLLDRVESVHYTLSTSYPDRNRRITDRESQFKLKELAWGSSFVRAEVKIKGQPDLVRLECDIQLTETGPRI